LTSVAAVARWPTAPWTTAQVDPAAAAVGQRPGQPGVTLLIDHYAGDWSKLWWVRLDGTGRIVDRPGEADRALELLSAKYPQYRRQPPDGPVLAIDIAAWHAWP